MDTCKSPTTWRQPTPDPSQEGNLKSGTSQEGNNKKVPSLEGIKGWVKRIRDIQMKRKTILPYNPKIKTLARELRNNSTLSEVLLWQHLKKKQMKGYDFDRQKPIDNYIVDFFCNELMLAIEIDGISHENKTEEDRLRQVKLESLGVRFLRFYDSDVKKNMQGVIAMIEEWIRENEPTSDPSKEGN